MLFLKNKNTCVSVRILQLLCWLIIIKATKLLAAKIGPSGGTSMNISMPSPATTTRFTISKTNLFSTVEYNALNASNKLRTIKSNSTNATSKRQRPRRRNPRRGRFLSENQQKLCISLFSVVAITGVIGNSLVIYIYGFSSRKRFLKFERLMLILGIVDLFASLTNPLFYIYQTSLQFFRWDFGDVGCRVLPALGPISSNISLGIILIMSIDRDRAVVTPFKKQFTTKTIYKAVAFTIIASIAVISPYMYYQQLNKKGRCRVSVKYIKQFARYGLIVFLTSGVLFLLILGVTTVRVFFKLTTSNVLSYPKSKEFRVRETKRILRIITAMGITFVVLIFPRDLVQMAYMYTFLNPPVIKIPNYLFVNAMLKLLHTSNSSVNVFLYSIVNRRFRREVIKLFMKSRYIRVLSSRYYQTSSDSTSASDTMLRQTSSKYYPKVNKTSKCSKLPAELNPSKTPTAESLNGSAVESLLRE